MTVSEEACDKAEDYLEQAIERIDHHMEESGYAKMHPELIGAYMQAAALDVVAAMLSAIARHLDR